MAYGQATAVTTSGSTLGAVAYAKIPAGLLGC